MQIRTLIERRLSKRGEVRAADIIKATGFSRTYVNRILQQLQREGKLHLIGKANRARYVAAHPRAVAAAIGSERSFHRTLNNRNLEEDVVLTQVKSETGIFKGVPRNIAGIVAYGFTEMLNNAIEHSQSEQIGVRLERGENGIWFTVLDRGIGIFRNIMATRKLATEREAIQDLLKGKQTTIPERHTGEGIFFTSKAADRLEIRSSDKKLIFDSHVGDVFVRTVKARSGTQVDFWIGLNSRRTLASVFRKFTGNEYAFDKTLVAVSLYKVGPGFVSRSQARRVLAGLDRFRTIVLDFKNVELVGQGFVDEVFRVWKSQHPGKSVQVKNADPNVQLMINYVTQERQRS